jgi:hypothetical protein
MQFTTLESSPTSKQAWVWPATEEDAMDQKIVWWTKLTPARDSTDPAAEDPLAQEDAESRIMIGHYLRLAERLLSATPYRSLEEEEAEAA